MKKFLLIMSMFPLASAALAQTWDFTSVSDADRTAMNGDPTSWSYDSKNDRFAYVKALSNEAVLAGGVELDATAGLKFTVSASSSGNLRLGYKSGCCLWLAGSSRIFLPSQKGGDFVKVSYATSSNGSSRTLIGENTDGTFTASTTKKTKTESLVRVVNDGDVALTLDGALYVYSIIAGDSVAVGLKKAETGGENPDNPTDTERGMNYMDAAQITTPAAVDSVVIWCSPDAATDDSGDGTEQSPYYHLQAAVDKALPGTTIRMKAGVYKYDSRININGRNGTHDKYITVLCPDGRATLDFSSMPYHKHSDNPQQGIRLTSSYWHFYKIDVCNASDNGILIERDKPEGGSSKDILNRTMDGHDNIIEFCNFYKNGDTGMQIKNLGSFNYILNCDSYENRDEDDGDADGFAPKISVGDGNYFFGCRAYNNSDDGYDVFFKKDGGFTDNKTIVFENCLAYENGYIDGGATKTKGNMNGFKCGSDQGRMNVVLNRCVAVANGSKGFDQNHNSGDIIMNNCTGYALQAFGGKKSYSYRVYEELAEGSVVEVTNCVAINDNLKTDKHPNDASKHGDGSKKYGRVEINTTDVPAIKVTTSDISVDPSNVQSEDDYADLIAPRDDNGNLKWETITWGHPTLDNALLVDKGTAVEASTRYASSGVSVPAIEYSGVAPDLGAFEQGLQSKVVEYGKLTSIEAVSSADNGSNGISMVQAFNGMVIVNVAGAKASDKFVLTLYSLSGQKLGEHTFNGTNTSIYLPAGNQIIILNVKGRGFNQSVKISTK